MAGLHKGKFQIVRWMENLAHKKEEEHDSKLHIILFQAQKPQV
jgi:hypothetical protein